MTVGRGISAALAPALDVRPADSRPARPVEAEVWRDAAGAVFAECGVEAGRFWMDLPGVALFRFDRAGDRVSAAPGPGVAADAVAEAYWRDALPLVLHARGAEVLHASAVRLGGGVVAFCGTSGAGKSTIAYGLHRRGRPLWADDAVALQVVDGAVAVRAVPFSVRLRPATRRLFDLDRPAPKPPSPAGIVPSGTTGESPTLSRDGAAVDRGHRVSAAGARGRAASAPLAAVCLIARGAPDARLSPLGPAAAYPGVLLHAFCFSLGDPARKRLMLARYLSLVARVPVLALGVPEGLDRLPEVLDAIERGLGDGPGR